MNSSFFKVKVIVELFPQKGGWYYVKVPITYTTMSKDRAVRGLVPIVAKIETYEWKTSLLPFGDGTHFIALNAKVRNLFKIDEGDKLDIEFKFR